MRNKKLLERLRALGMSAAMLATAVSISPSLCVSAEEETTVPEMVVSDATYDFARALQYSIYFYDANMCGEGVDENDQYSWRGDCHTYDATMTMDAEATNMTADFIEANRDVLDPDGDGYIDVSGGFHDAGDHVKFGLPEAYTGSTLGWGYYEFRDSYQELGQAEHIETILRYFNDYFMKCTFRDENGDVVAFCYQVGDGDIDHSYWNAPEIDDMFRRGWFATASLPTTDCITNTAASLAANYMNFKDTDPDYAAECLDYAEALFAFAEKNEKAVGASEDGPKGYYGSNKWQDDYCWGAMWLYIATGDVTYRDYALSTLGNDYYAPSCWTHCWNDVWNGAVILMAECDDAENGALVERFLELSGKSPYENIDFWSQIAKTCDNWMSGGTPSITPAGYSFLSIWGSARYNTATQLVALVYDKHNNGGPSTYSDWAKGQMEYLLGANPNELSYVVGYNENSVKYPHHRAASGLSKCEDTGEHRYVLYGALVGGPGANDEHIDLTSDYIYNEVTIDYNAAFVGACAGLYEYYGDETMAVTQNFPPPVSTSEDGEESANDFWVEAFAVDDIQSGVYKVTNLTMYVMTNSNKAAKNLSIRYYFDASGMESVLTDGSFQLQQLYDQTSAETDYAAELTGPIQYDGSIYYIEVKWDGYAIANSNKKYQVALGTYNVNYPWNPLDDWSYNGINIETSMYEGTVERTDNICVYSDGVLVGGIEPDGTTVTQTTTTTADAGTGTTTTSTTTTTTTIAAGGDGGTTNPLVTMYGDVTLDEDVSVSDLIYLARYVAEDAGIEAPSEVALANADCNQDEYVNADDVSLISKVLAHIITQEDLG